MGLFSKPRQAAKASADAVAVAPDQLAVLAVEHWRLTEALKTENSTASSGAARHALRKIGEFLAGLGFEARSLDGLVYDAGLSAKVVDRVEDERVPPGVEAIIETVSPLVLCNGQVVRAAEVVVGVGPVR